MHRVYVSYQMITATRFNATVLTIYCSTLIEFCTVSVKIIEWIISRSSITVWGILAHGLRTYSSLEAD